MAKNGDAGVGEVAEAPGVGLDERDRAVHALGYGVGDAVALSKPHDRPLYQGDRAAYPVDVSRLPKAQFPQQARAEEGTARGPLVRERRAHRDLDGKSCKNRVKSLFGATSRKGTSPEEEADVRLDWGVKNSAQGSAKPVGRAAGTRRDPLPRSGQRRRARTLPHCFRQPGLVKQAVVIRELYDRHVIVVPLERDRSKAQLGPWRR